MTSTVAIDPQQTLGKQAMTSTMTVGEDMICKWHNEKGELHREDGPAVEDADGCKIWYINGKKHRIGHPAVEDGDLREWYVDNQRHRDDGPAFERGDHHKAWYRHGKRHRENGPAVILPNGCQEWYLDGKRHRDDGPALVHADGREEWWINDQQLTAKQFADHRQKQEDQRREEIKKALLDTAQDILLSGTKNRTPLLQKMQLRNPSRVGA